MNSNNPFSLITSTLSGDPPVVKDVGQTSYRRQHFSDGKAKSGIGNLHSLMKKSDLGAWSHDPKLRHHVLLPFLAQVEHMIATINDERELVSMLRMLLADYKDIFDTSLLDIANQDFVKLAGRCKMQIIRIREYPIDLDDAHVSRWKIRKRVNDLLPEARRKIEAIESKSRIIQRANSLSASPYLSEKRTPEESVSYQVAQIIASDLDDFEKAREAHGLIRQTSSPDPFLKRVRERFISHVFREDGFATLQTSSQNPLPSKIEKSTERMDDPRLIDILARLKKKGNNSYKNAPRTDIINTIAELKALRPMTPEISGYIERFSRLNAGTQATRISKKKAYSTGSPIGQHLGETK